MKRLHIDFAPHSLKRVVKRTTKVTWIVGGAGLVLCIGAALSAAALMRDREAVAAEIARSKAQLEKHTALMPAPKKFAIPEGQANAVNNAVGQLNLPWRDVLDALEAATPTTVALLALEPDAKKQLLKGMAEAKTSDGMIAYIERLKQQKFFKAVVLTRHEINEQDPNRPLRFQFEAQWGESAL